MSEAKDSKESKDSKEGKQNRETKAVVPAAARLVGMEVMEKVREMNAAWGTPEARRVAESFRPRPTDIFIATFPKAGTTWLQQITYQLVSGGNTDYEELSAVSPWPEVAYHLKQDLDKFPAPRVMKSHDSADGIQKGGCKYIACLRDPFDVASSFYNFFKGWQFDDEREEYFEAFCEVFVFAKRFNECGTMPTMFEHMLGWWLRRKDSNVLFMTYEDMTANNEQCIRAIAQFCKIDLTPKLLTHVLETSSFEYMKKHESLFDDHKLRAAVNPLMGIPLERKFFKIKNGRVGRGKERVSPRLLERFDNEFRKVFEPHGISTYWDLRATSIVKAKSQ